jgi:hypothetical protein
MRTVLSALLLPLALWGLAPDAALGYGGPGSVISGIGAVLAALGALLAALLGFVWYPLKRLYRYFAEKEEPEKATTEPTGE